MTQIKIAVSTLPIAQKLLRGQNIITQSTNNPDVPGNAVPLADFAAKQAAFEAAVADAIAKREAVRNATIVQEQAEAEWRASLTLLAAFTENATGGVLPNSPRPASRRAARRRPLPCRTRC